jgi:ubiquinone/menaquinone biosynthesis C-methylase UbiE
MERADYILQNVKGRTLDAGYACGTLHERLAGKLGKENVYGLDIEGRIKDSRHVKGSAEKMPFRDNEFRCVVAGELIEHLGKPSDFLRECARVTEKGGVLLITTPNRKSLVNRLTHSYEAPAHLTLFSESELRELLQECGFRIREVRYFPYTGESNYGSRNRWSFFLRNLIHNIIPDSLRENMAFAAERL